jgi:hypothetical protein
MNKTIANAAMTNRNGLPKMKHFLFFVFTAFLFIIFYCFANY